MEGEEGLETVDRAGVCKRAIILLWTGCTIANLIWDQFKGP